MAGSTTSSPPIQCRKVTNGDVKYLQPLADGDGIYQPPKESQTALQQHTAFFDRDNDGIIWPWDVYNGFRELGFCILFSLGSLLIPVFFSYPTRMGRSWIPDPLLRIYVDDIHKAKHGSDSGIYDFDGKFDAEKFDHVFDRFDTSGTGGLSVGDLAELLKKDRCAADPAGWSFAFMEWWTTWLLLQKDGRVWKDDLRACYEGSLFWKISEERSKGKEWQKGYGVIEFLNGMLSSGTWRYWEIRGK
ncbi:Caleosin-domain-containing protein [Hypoxylon trugodes]|uniref:Caleosin-domain-containing protein n=1 Tax=Hypoxylon trugodes TaxID=326681 RepID=UPI0021956042|nr:Caleosin-domain-containing protein [Hypoxylon trugodes]KAI1387413.1 Caleosin-domain-containing protein [Hypoxylon trugodes]